MPITCTADALAELAACLEGLSSKQHQAIQNYLLCQIAGGVTPEETPMIYRALLTQTGTNAPSVIVLENTLGGTPVWIRDDVGIYLANLTGAFPAALTFSTISNNNVSPGTSMSLNIATDDQIQVTTAVFSTAPSFDNSDGLLTNTSIEILVYP